MPIRRPYFILFMEAPAIQLSLGIRKFTQLGLIHDKHATTLHGLALTSPW